MSKHTKLRNWDHFCEIVARRVNAANDAGHPEWVDLPETRSIARAMRLTAYFTGKPCKHHHIAPRGVNEGCAGCYVKRHPNAV